jgi:chromosome segregation ATPase
MAKELESRLGSVSADLERTVSERDRVKSMLEQVSGDRDKLFEELKIAQEEVTNAKQAVRSMPKVEETSQKEQKPVGTDSYWEDVIRRKAELESEKEELLGQLRSKDVQLKDMETKSKEFEIQLADLGRVKSELEAAINFKERTLAIVTKDLVKEREDRKVVMSQIDKLKEENMSLVREHKFLGRIQSDLETKLKSSIDEKDILNRKVDEIQTVLKDKALDIDSLQKQLSRSVASAKDVMPDQAKAVALPPIVVKADNQPSRAVSTLEGKVMAVNGKEQFVIVDLGATNGVKPGDKFEVYNKGNKIATLSVIETRKDISACDIIESSPSASIKEGDMAKIQG